MLLWHSSGHKPEDSTQQSTKHKKNTRKQEREKQEREKQERKTVQKQGGERERKIKRKTERKEGEVVWHKGWIRVGGQPDGAGGSPGEEANGPCARVCRVHHILVELQEGCLKQPYEAPHQPLSQGRHQPAKQHTHVALSSGFVTAAYATARKLSHSRVLLS